MADIDSRLETSYFVGGFHVGRRISRASDNLERKH